MNKSIESIDEAIACISDGSTVMISGFGGAGAPIELIHSLIDRYLATGHPKNLTVVNNNAGTGQVGLGALIHHGMVGKLICSFPRSQDPKAFNERYAAGELELELVPQGTLAERIRAAGAGIPAFYTRTAYGTELGAGKPTAEFDGVTYLQERALKADFALVKAHYGDLYGNLTYRFAARNFAPLMCMAAKHTIAQVAKLVEPGTLNPEEVVTPGIFVQSVIEVPDPKQEEILVQRGVTYP